MSSPLARTCWSASVFFRVHTEKKLPYRPLERICAQQDRRVRALIATAQSLLGGDMRIEATRVAAIPAEPGGEVRAVISHCRPRHAV